ncbi:SNF1-related protein kinase regulatory subunit beta-2 [Camellia lanceoleosa]|uniref:SNF1-related protein kinase regulatory subunit beta-2 n=1 Tax=Camellia lanceoleosa TaxID=1840588 RepID=A0ACC0H227_9ERIC|nr:SNF1-related protein kinase regulatory subunit beta-2 [Camellia lanceoleosa]
MSLNPKVMGNVSGRKDEEAGCSSGTKHEEGEDDEEEYMMEYAHGGGGARVSYHAHGPFPESMVQSPPHSPRAYHSPLMFTPQVPVNPVQRPDEMMQIQSNVSNQNATQNYDLLSETLIPTMITWRYHGKEVAIEGSWDNWKTRDFLQKTDNDFAIIKVLPSGVYHLRFIVDGQWRHSPDLPQERDDLGNIFNVLDLQDFVPEVLNNNSESESPSSPFSSYNNLPFSLEDFNEKLPELPPLLQQSPLDQSSSSRDSTESLEKPLAAVLNHLYIQKGRTGESLVALNSTHRFRTKYVTVVLYKPLKKAKK